MVRNSEVSRRSAIEVHPMFSAAHFVPPLKVGIVRNSTGINLWILTVVTDAPTICGAVPPSSFNRRQVGMPRRLRKFTPPGCDTPVLKRVSQTVNTMTLCIYCRL